MHMLLALGGLSGLKEKKSTGICERLVVLGVSGGESKVE